MTGTASTFAGCSSHAGKWSGARSVSWIFRIDMGQWSPAFVAETLIWWPTRSISIPLPGGASLELGLAGGSLIVGLIVGAVGRTGPFVWQLPHSTAITLRQFGVVLFLAGIGTRAGDTFATTLRNEGLDIIVVGVFITTLTSLAMLIIGHRVLGVPMGYLIGALAGLLTQPAVLAYATEQAGEGCRTSGTQRSTQWR